MLMASIAPDPNASIAPSPHRPKRFKGFLPWYWENYLLCLLFHLLVPLLPIGFEAAFTGTVKQSSMLLAASFYIIGIGVSSVSRLFFGASIVVGLIFAAIYGNEVARNMPSGTPPAAVARQAQGGGPREGNPWPAFALLGFGVAHAGERFMRHVIGRAPYFEFLPEEEE
jgi:hypothetical protein